MTTVMQSLREHIIEEEEPAATKDQSLPQIPRSMSAPEAPDFMVESPSSSKLARMSTFPHSAYIENNMDSTINHSHHVGFSEMTPEKLALMRLNNAGDDIFSDPGSPENYTKHRTSLGRSLSQAQSHSWGEGGARSMARSTRHVSGASRRTSSFMHSHRSKMSMELTSQAEGKFYSLIELMTNASKEASSLKEYWTRLMTEREGFEQEREELLARIEEVTETLERRESQHQHHGRELGDRKKEIERLLIELSAALNEVSQRKHEISERDHELERVRAKFSETSLVVSRSQTEGDGIKVDLENALAKLRLREDERDHAKQDAERFRDELRSVTREHTEIKAKYTDITSKYESTRREISTLSDKLKAWEHERADLIIEKDRLHDDLKKSNIRYDDIQRELFSITELHERTQRELRQAKEAVRFVESERDEHVSTIERLRSDVKSKLLSIEEAEGRVTDSNLRVEQSKREISTKDERIRDLENELSDVRSRLERSQEDHRSVIIVRDQYQEDLEEERRKATHGTREMTTLQETLSKVEATLSGMRSEVSVTNERIKHVERERDEFRDRNGHLDVEVHKLKERLALLQAEMRGITDARDRARKDLDEFRRRYEEVTETITEFQGETGEYEYEIDSLRIMLREAREQKERAISARTAADRERDEYMSKYEEKCREMERFEESRASHYRSQAGGGGKSTSTRTVTRNGSSFHASSKLDDGE